MYVNVYYVPKKNKFYYKVVKYEWHREGYVNSYGHQLMFIIPLNSFIYKEKYRFRKHALAKMIQFLERCLLKLNRKG